MSSPHPSGLQPVWNLCTGVSLISISTMVFWEFARIGSPWSSDCSISGGFFTLHTSQISPTNLFPRLNGSIFLESQKQLFSFSFLFFFFFLLPISIVSYFCVAVTNTWEKQVWIRAKMYLCLFESLEGSWAPGFKVHTLLVWVHCVDEVVGYVMEDRNQEARQGSKV